MPMVPTSTRFYEDFNMFETIIPLLQQANRVGIFTHQNPDGDAMGSAYALKLVLVGMGKEAEVYLLPNPDAMAYPLISGMESSGLLKEDCDLLAAVDCADSRRLGEYEDFFVSHPNTVAIDHHITHQSFAGETAVQDISSTCELMCVLFAQMGIALTQEVAANLYTGLVCDTGNFKYSCTSPETLRRAADLIAVGIDFARISKRVFNTKSPAYYTLMRTALDRLQFYENDRVCALYLSQQDFEDAGIDESMATGIVTLPTGIEGVEVGVYIRKRGEGEYKVSLRSVERVDVAAIAAAMGGGGHVRAAGYSVYDKSPEEIVAQALQEIQKQLDV